MKRLLIFLSLLLPMLASAASTPVPANYIRETGRFVTPASPSMGSLSVTGTLNVGTLNATNGAWNVRASGAVGDGVVNDTVALSNAFLHLVVYIPTGRYLVDPLIFTNSTLFGDGDGSVLVLRTPSNGETLLTVGAGSLVRDLSLFGNTTNIYSTGSDAPQTVGILEDMTRHGGLRNLKIESFKTGLEMIGIDSISTRQNNSAVHNLAITNCFYGMFLNASNTIEYTRISDCSITLCTYGVWNAGAANIIVSGNKISDLSNIAIMIAPSVTAADSYRGHSIYIGNQLNHTAGITVNGAANAEFIGNQMLAAGTIQLINATNCIFRNNFLGLDNITVGSTNGSNFFGGNHFIGVPSMSGTATQQQVFLDNWVSTTPEGTLATFGPSYVATDWLGNVGIGTTTPANRLHLKSPGLGFIRIEGTLPAIQLLDMDAAIAALWHNDGYLQFGNFLNAVWMVVDVTTGNVGIGTTAPTSGRLVIDGGALTFGTDNTYDIGASGANRPRNVHAASGFASYSSNGLAATTVTIGASPVLWTNTTTKNVAVYIDGVSVTGTVGINGTTVFGTIGQNTILLQPNEYTTITFTIGTPTAKWKPF